MAGAPRYNFDRFEAAAALLRDRGADVCCPVDAGHAGDFDFDAEACEQSAVTAQTIREHLDLLASADVVAVLPGSEDSPEVAVDKVVADSLGIPVVCLRELLGEQS